MAFNSFCLYIGISEFSITIFSSPWSQ